MRYDVKKAAVRAMGTVWQLAEKAFGIVAVRMLVAVFVTMATGAGVYRLGAKMPGFLAFAGWFALAWLVVAVFVLLTAWALLGGASVRIESDECAEVQIND